MPRWIIGPNRIHYWWIPEWRDAYPEAGVYLAPRISGSRPRSHIDFAAHELLEATGYPWDNKIATLPVPGSYMTEFELLPPRKPHACSYRHHREISNREARLRTDALVDMACGDAQDPDGQMPRDMRLTFSRNRTELTARRPDAIAGSLGELFLPTDVGMTPTAPPSCAVRSGGSLISVDPRFCGRGAVAVSGYFLMFPFHGIGHSTCSSGELVDLLTVDDQPCRLAGHSCSFGRSHADRRQRAVRRNGKQSS